MVGRNSKSYLTDRVNGNWYLIEWGEGGGLCEAMRIWIIEPMPKTQRS